ncbi:MAG: hypothetical protein AAFX90_21110 [Pseudomonadota bacterium]
MKNFERRQANLQTKPMSSSKRWATPETALKDTSITLIALKHSRSKVFVYLQINTFILMILYEKNPTVPAYV